MADYQDSQVQISPPLYMQYEDYKYRYLFASIRNSLINPISGAEGGGNILHQLYEFENAGSTSSGSIHLALVYIKSLEGTT